MNQGRSREREGGGINQAGNVIYFEPLHLSDATLGKLQIGRFILYQYASYLILDIAPDRSSILAREEPLPAETRAVATLYDLPDGGYSDSIYGTEARP